MGVGLLVGFGVGARDALLGIGLVLLPALMLIAVSLPVLRVPKPKGTQSQSLPPIPAGLCRIGLVVFGASSVEGAMNDWATVYMREAPWGGTSRDGLAVTVFAGMVTAGRFAGERPVATAQKKAY